MNNPLVLVVEDDLPVRNLMTTTLKTHDYKFKTAANAAEALLMASSHNPDVVFLDLGLPDMDGVDIITRVRMWSNVPIIVISARSEDSDKIGALDAGADDYLTKPFMTQELLARLRALGRRTLGTADGVLSYGDISLDTATLTLSCTRNGQSVRLSEKEYRILEYFIANSGQILTREQLASKIWGFESDAEYNNVEVYMSFTRKKLAFVEARTEIKAVRGVGYELRWDDV